MQYHAGVTQLLSGCALNSAMPELSLGHGVVLKGIGMAYGLQLKVVFCWRVQRCYPGILGLMSQRGMECETGDPGSDVSSP